MISKRTTLILALSLLMGGWSTLLHAQVQYYQFTQSYQAYTEITGGTVLGNTSNSPDQYYVSPDSLSPAFVTQGNGLSIGFEFLYRGVLYDRFAIANDGWIYLGRSLYDTIAVDAGPDIFQQAFNTDGADNDTLRCRIAAFATNLAGNGNNTELSYQISGEPTNQVLTIQWKNYQINHLFYQNTTVNFQIRLFEADDRIEIQYGNISFTGLNFNNHVQVGITGFNPGDYLNRRHNIAEADWDSTLEGTSFLNTVIASSSVSPPTPGLQFTYIAPSCIPPSTAMLTEIGLTMASFSWEPPYTYPSSGYMYALSESIEPPAVGDITFDQEHTFSSLLTGTDYYFHIRSICSPGDSSIWLTVPITTICLPLSLPYAENFDLTAIGDLPPCYRAINTSPFSKPFEVPAFTPWNGSIPNTVGVECGTINEGEDWLFTPGFILTVGEEYYFTCGYQGYDTLQLLAGTFPAIADMSMIDFMYPNPTTNYQSFSFVPAISDTFYFAFFAQDCDIFIDNIEIWNKECGEITNLEVIETEADSLVFSWTAESLPDVGFEYELQLYYQFLPLEPQLTTDTFLLFQFLMPSTTYILSLRSVCLDGVTPWQFYTITTPPENDECADAIELIPEASPYCNSAYYTTRGATSSGIPSSTCGGDPDDDVWFWFVPTSRTHLLSIQSITGAEDLIVETFTAGCESPVQDCGIAGAYDAITMYVSPLEIGDTAFIRIYGSSQQTQSGDFYICIGTLDSEVEDSCETAEILIVDNPVCSYTGYADLAGATPGVEDASTCATENLYDVWYVFEAIDTIHVVSATFSNQVDGILQIFSGECGDLIELACILDPLSDTEEVILNELEIGETYYVRVTESSGIGPQCEVITCVRTLHSNDECTGAFEIMTVSGPTFADPFYANNQYATGVGGCGQGEADDDLWYKFTAVNDTHIIVLQPELGYGIVDPIIEVFADQCGGISIGCSDTQELILSALQPDSTYYFRVFSSANGSGEGGYQLYISTPPVNYLCASAIPIDVTSGHFCQQPVIGSNIGSGQDLAVWFSFVPSDSIVVALLETLSGFPHHMNFYTVCDSVLLPGVNYNRMEYNHFIPGETYLIRIGSFGLEQGTFSLCLLSAPNDECAGAEEILAGLGCENEVTGYLQGGTLSAAPEACEYGQRDVWYSFQATQTFHRIRFHQPNSLVRLFGEMYSDSCGGELISCYDYNLFSNDTRWYLEDLEVGKHYVFRIQGFLTNTDSFTICLDSPVINDECSRAITLDHPLTTTCNPLSSASGTNILATSSDGSTSNVWYHFVASARSIAVRVDPKTAGFDPAIRIFKKMQNGAYDLCTQGSAIQSTDITHSDFQPEVLLIGTLTGFGGVMQSLIIGEEYLIEVSSGPESTNDGEFDICLSTLTSAMRVHSAEYTTYDYDTIAPRGKWQQPVLKISLRMSGYTNQRTLQKIVLNTEGTTDPGYIRRARLMVDTRYTFGHIDAPYDPYGSPSSAYPVSIPYQFGQTIENPEGSMTFTGTFLFESANYPYHYERYLYLVYDIECDASEGSIVNGKCESITLNNQLYPVFKQDTSGLPIGPIRQYDTEQNGDWESPDTWMCISVPPDSAGMAPVSINHHVTASDTQTLQDLTVHFERSLALLPGTVMTLGASSAGINHGYSNAFLDARLGTLTMDSTMLHINGAIFCGQFLHPEVGALHVSNTNWYVDGNDGHGSTSIQNNLINIANEDLDWENFNIQILDPGIHPGFSEFVLHGAILSGTRLPGIFTFGGGDDISPSADDIGFSMAFNTGFLRPDSLVIAGGMQTEKRHTTGLEYAKNVFIAPNAEYNGSLIMSGHLRNEGLITSEHPREIVFCGQADLANYFTNTFNPQRIYGNGYFRSSPLHGIPTESSENYISKLVIANTAGGVFLEMPLGVRNLLRLRHGTLHTSQDAMLTLGDSSQAGQLVTVLPAPYQNDPNRFYETPYDRGLANWDGGYVNGFMRRWYQEGMSGENSLLPVGSDLHDFPVSISFAGEDTSYVTVGFIEENPGTDGMPLFNEQAADLNNVSPTGYWQIETAEPISSADIALKANGMTRDEVNPLIIDTSSIRLIRRNLNQQWTLSGSTTMSGPETIDSIAINSVPVEGEYAIGLNCNLVVTNANDGGPGSLRYIIEHCAQPGDTIRFAANMQLIYISMDTMILDKNLTIVNTVDNDVILQSDDVHSTIKIVDGTLVTLDNLTVQGGFGVEASAILNAGHLTLTNVIVRNGETGVTAIVNLNELYIQGTSAIKLSE